MNRIDARQVDIRGLKVSQSRMGRKKTRLLLVDDERLHRQLMGYRLQAVPDVEVVGSAGTGREAVALAERLKPHVILMDVRMRGMNGVEATRWIHRDWPEIVVLALTVYDDDATTLAMLRAGAAGCLYKACSDDELIAAIRQVALGGLCFPDRILRLAVAGGRLGQNPDRECSGREREILHCMAQGLCVKEIAHELCIDISTVHTHRQRLMKKLGLHCEASLIRYAILSGF